MRTPEAGMEYLRKKKASRGRSGTNVRGLVAKLENDKQFVLHQR